MPSITAEMATATSQLCADSDSTLPTAPAGGSKTDIPLCDTTLASLAASFHDESTSADERMIDVIERLRSDPNSIGVMVLEGHRLKGVISRELLGRDLAKPFYRELCERRPVREFLKLTGRKVCEFPQCTGISTAVEAAMARPPHDRYEPIIVRRGASPFLLDVPALLAAQCDLLNNTLKALEAQRCATQAAEHERQLLHEQLLVASRQAGRAEVATGVLHNVGNVLNSVNVSASVITRMLEQSKLPGLSKAVHLMRDNSADIVTFMSADERGKRLPGYLEKLSETLAIEHASLAQEVLSLAQGLEHIKHVVQMQQTYAKDSAVLVPTEPCQLFEDALKVNLVSFERHHVTIERRFPSIPQVRLDKHRVLQILINLVSNAKDAVKAHAGPEKRITVAVSFDQTTDMLRFSVSDTGIGIAPHHLTSIFQHGFTTRSEGHGFGLHSSANVAHELGGTLRAHSDGPGRGATFVLELPAQVEAVR